MFGLKNLTVLVFQIARLYLSQLQIMFAGAGVSGYEVGPQEDASRNGSLVASTTLQYLQPGKLNESGFLVNVKT